MKKNLHLLGGFLIGWSLEVFWNFNTADLVTFLIGLVLLVIAVSINIPRQPD